MNDESGHPPYSNEKAALLRDFHDLRQAAEELMRRIQDGEDALNSKDIPPEAIKRMRVLVGDARGVIDKLQLTTYQANRLEIGQKSEAELRNAAHAYYRDFIKPQINLNNSKKSKDGSFCHEIHGDDLNGLRPIIIDPKNLGTLIRIRHRKNAKAIELYKQERYWSEVVWISVDGNIFALNIAKDAQGEVIKIRAVEISLSSAIFGDIHTEPEVTRPRKKWWPFSK